jgi:8-hydroxy-5-deazaflavin:NADPH oxidoreductase
MKIGIIGAGNSGGTLTRRFTALGHKVFVANSRGPETLADLATETGAVRQALAKASKERKPEWGATSRSPGMYEHPA